MEASPNATGFFTGIANSEIAFALLEFLPVILAVTILAVLPPSFFTEHRLTHGLRPEVVAGDREKVGAPAPGTAPGAGAGASRPSVGRAEDSDGLGGGSLQGQRAVV